MLLAVVQLLTLSSSLTVVGGWILVVAGWRTGAAHGLIATAEAAQALVPASPTVSTVAMTFVAY